MTENPMRITLSVLLVLLVIAIGPMTVPSQERSCSEHDAMEAEDTVTNLRNWEDVYRSFKQFGHCDNGTIADGYSASVVRLLSDHWDQLGDLNKLSSDRKFLAFVIKHIDATVDEHELRNVIINSEKNCPKSAKMLCSLIEKAAKKAWMDMYHQK
jgi:hypothetical protein